MSSIELVGSYLAERARLSVFVPLALLIAATAWLAAPGVGEQRTLAAFGPCAVRALALVLALRIWDDIEDRERDAHRHADRVVVRATRITPLTFLSVSLAVAAGMSLMNATAPLTRFAILLITVLGLDLWYRVRPAGPSRLSASVVLAKYPALSIALAPGLDDIHAARAVAAAGVLYLIAWTYEYLDDRSRGIS